MKVNVEGVELRERGKIVLNVNESLNVNDKSITVPANVRVRHIEHWAEFTCTSTAGTRTINNRILDNATDADIIGALTTRASPTASQTLRTDSKPGQAQGETGSYDGSTIARQGTLPKWSPAGTIFQTFDSANIASGYDDLILQFMWEEFG